MSAVRCRLIFWTLFSAIFGYIGLFALPSEANTLLKGLEEELISLAEELSPQVVAISCGSELSLGGEKRKIVVSRGSGFIISDDGFILTNQHVIDGAKFIDVSLWDGRQFSARLIGEDKRFDLAVVKIDLPFKLSAVKFGDLKSLRRGQFVFTISNPLGLSIDGQLAFSFGCISAVGRHIPNVDIKADRYYGNLIQTTVPISIGSSGSPLYNLDGEVVGINTIVSSARSYGAALGFAIPISSALKDLIMRLKSGERIRHGFLGVMLADVPGKDGARVVSVAKDTPASKAGIKSGDIIIEADGKKILSVDQFILLISMRRPGDSMQLKIERDSVVFSVDVIVADRGDFIK